MNPRTPTANGTSRLDVASPGVNFLMKSDTVVLIMTGSPTRAIHVRQKPCTHGLADADIVSAFPLSFNTFQENDIVNIGLHFFLKDVRPMLPPVMNRSIVDA